MVRKSILALAAFAAQFAAGQNGPAGSSLEDRIRHVTSGLLDPVVIKGTAPTAHSLADRMKELKVPGVSIAVIHQSKIEWARGFGVRTLGGSPVTVDTRFQAASISKPVATMAALRLVEQGKLSLDKDINVYLKSWKLPGDPSAAGKLVTLRELITHTAGITVHGFPGYASTEPVPTLVQVLNGEKPANTSPIRSEAAPGSKWQYSGGGFTIMQQTLIDVTKEPFPKLLHDSVLAPIGMLHSTYEQPLPKALRENAATPYRDDGKAVEGGAHTYPEMAAAGLWTTPSDLARYAIEVQQSLQGKSNRVLSVEMTRQMLTPGIGNWGLGIGVDGAKSDPYFSHGGANDGFRCILVAYEKSGEGAVVMTNSDAGGRLGDEIIRGIAAEYGWPDYRSTVRTRVRVDTNILAQYAGTFELEKGFDLVITLEKGQLMAQATGQENAPIYPESATKFFSTGSSAEIEFFKDGTGKVNRLVLHQGGRDIGALKK